MPSVTGAGLARMKLLQVLPSSSVKADDPVRRAGREPSYAGTTGYLLSAGMTAMLGASFPVGIFVSCAFAQRGECWPQHAKNPEGVRMSALQSVSANSHAAGTEPYDVVVVGPGFAGMYMRHRLPGQALSVPVCDQAAAAR